MKIILGVMLIGLILSIAVLITLTSYLLWDEVRDTWEDNKRKKRFEEHMEQTIRSKNDQDCMR